MKKALFKFFITYIAYLLIFIVGKPLFMLVYHELYSDISISDALAIMWHGLPIDFATAAYLTVIPGILIAIMLTCSSRILRTIEHFYHGIVTAVIAIIIVVDLVLYSYWGFRLDATPLFYFFSSPEAALASAEWWQAILGVIAIALVSIALYYLLKVSALRITVAPVRRKACAVVAMLILTAALFIPIRGSFTVSTMNPSRAFFSIEKKLNHAAANPAFSFLYSVSHQNNFSEQFRFMEAADADSIFSSLVYTKFVPDTLLLNTKRPDIWIIIAESFSANLMSSLGGEPIAHGLDSIASEGALFTRFYASTFRTDRAIPAILSAFPAQPNTSLMKFVNKIENLPSLPNVLRTAGYNTRYYYGGDVNFANTIAYLMSCGFEHVVYDKDFTPAQRASKWGAHDSDLFDRVIADMAIDNTSLPRLRVVQTSSSHEPFEVPFTSQFADKRLNAFAYTDSCIAAFVDTLQASPQWDNSLVVIVPDHVGAYTDGLNDEQGRHHVPLIMTGGALKLHGNIDVVGSQTDIAATILNALELPHSEFIYSKNLLDPAAPHFAFYTTPSSMGYVTATDTVEYSLESNRAVMLKGSDAESKLECAKAFLQKLYDNIDKL